MKQPIDFDKDIADHNFEPVTTFFTRDEDGTILVNSEVRCIDPGCGFVTVANARLNCLVMRESPSRLSYSDLTDGDLMIVLGLVRNEAESFSVIELRKDDRIPQHIVDYYDHLREIE